MFPKIKKALFLFQITVLIMLLAYTSFSQKDKIPDDWKRNDLPLFCFFTPSDLVLGPFKGKDSEVWKYESQTLLLTIDLGLYSGKPERSINEGNYIERSITIDGKRAAIVYSDFNNKNYGEFKYVTAMYFPRVASDETKLSFVALSKTLEIRKNVEKIFRSIRFKAGR